MEKVIVINDYEQSSVEFLNYDLIEHKFENQKEEKDLSAFIEDYLISKNFSFCNIDWMVVSVENIFIRNSIFLSNEDRVQLLNKIN